MTVLITHALGITLAVFGLGCAIVGFFVGHTVRAEHNWQDYVDHENAYRARYPGQRTVRSTCRTSHRVGPVRGGVH